MRMGPWSSVKDAPTEPRATLRRRFPPSPARGRALQPPHSSPLRPRGAHRGTQSLASDTRRELPVSIRSAWTSASRRNYCSSLAVSDMLGERVAEGVPVQVIGVLADELVDGAEGALDPVE